MSEMIVLVHNNNGADWSFVRNRYVGHFRNGKTILLILDGAKTIMEIVLPDEDAAKAMGVNLNKVIQKAPPTRTRFWIIIAAVMLALACIGISLYLVKERSKLATRAEREKREALSSKLTTTPTAWRGASALSGSGAIPWSAASTHTR